MFGMANRDPETLTSYGVVSLISLADWVFDEFFQNGINLTADAALEEWRSDNPAKAADEDEDEFWDYYDGDEEQYRLETDGMILELSYLGGAPLVWVLKSPHKRSVRECSPCCPNAGDLDSPVEPGEGIVCYDLPHDWYFLDDCKVSA